jgi:hypothetical protein
VPRTYTAYYNVNGSCWVDESNATITIPQYTYSTGSPQVWGTWTQDSTATATASVWHIWNVRQGQWTVEAPAPLTPQQAAQENERRLRADEQQAIAQAERARIEVVAQELLHTLLDEQQMKQYAERKRVIVKGKKRRYEVGEDNRLFVREGSSVLAFCCHAPLHFPAGDRVAAAILELEADEDAVMRKGNRLTLSEGELRAIGERLRAA